MRRGAAVDDDGDGESPIVVVRLYRKSFEHFLMLCDVPIGGTDVTSDSGVWRRHQEIDDEQVGRGNRHDAAESQRRPRRERSWQYSSDVGVQVI